MIPKTAMQACGQQICSFDTNVCLKVWEIVKLLRHFSSVTHGSRSLCLGFVPNLFIVFYFRVALNICSVCPTCVIFLLKSKESYRIGTLQVCILEACCSWRVWQFRVCSFKIGHSKLVSPFGTELWKLSDLFQFCMIEESRASEG